MAVPGRGGRAASALGPQAQAGTVRLGAQGQGPGAGELASLVAAVEHEPASPVPVAQGSRVLRVEVNGLLHDWFDVDEMGDFVRSAAFAGTLRENVARYFGVPMEKQAIYDEDGLLTTSADFSRALQRVSPKLYVYDVLQMGQELRERTVEELEAIDAEVEQSWRHFGAYDSRSRQVPGGALGGPSLSSEKVADMVERGDKALLGVSASLEAGSAEGDRGGTSGSGWQPVADQAPVRPTPGGAATPAAPLAPAHSLLPAAQRRSGSVVSIGGNTAPGALTSEPRGRGTSDFGTTTPIAEYLKEASALRGSEEHAFSLFAPAAPTALAPSPAVAAPATAAAAASAASAPELQPEAAAAQLRGGVRVLSAGGPGLGKAQFLDVSTGPDITNATSLESWREVLLNSSGSSRTLPGDATLAPSVAPLASVVPAVQQVQQAGASGHVGTAAAPRYAAGTIGNPGGCLRVAPVAAEAQRREASPAEPAPLRLAGAPTAQPLQAQPMRPRTASTPATPAVTSAAPTAAVLRGARECVGAAASGGQSLRVLHHVPSQVAVEASARSPRPATRPATPPRATTPTAVTPRLAVSARRRSTTPVPVAVSPVWGQRPVQATAQPLAPQQWPLAQWPGVAASPPRSTTPRRSVTPSRRELQPQAAASLPMGGPALQGAVRSATPSRLAGPLQGAWRQPAAAPQPGAVPNAAMSLCEWSQAFPR